VHIYLTVIKPRTPDHQLAGQLVRPSSQYETPPFERGVPVTKYTLRKFLQIFSFSQTCRAELHYMVMNVEQGLDLHNKTYTRCSSTPFFFDSVRPFFKLAEII
jgi:hypothetical protein